MSEATKFFRNQIEESLLKLNTAMPCKVLSYSKSERTAKVQPLFMRKEKGREPSALPPLDGVPVLFQRFEVDGVTKTYTPVLQAGDTVFVVFAQRTLDHVMSGRVAYPGIHRRHSLIDAVIVGIM